MPTYDVSSIGFYVCDILGRPVTRIPDGGRADYIQEIRMTVAGTAGATAADCAILGLKTLAVTTVGEDEMGDFMVAKLTRFGVDCAMVARDGSVQTSATILPVRPNGERPALHVPGTAATFRIPEGRLDAALDARIVHVGGTGLLKSFDGAPTVEALRRAKELGRITTFDLIQATPETFELVRPCLPYIDYFVPSIEGGLRDGGHDRSGRGGALLQGPRREERDPDHGRGGVYVSPEAGEDFRLPAHAIEVVDTTGCGDSFTAGVIVGLARGWDLRDCCRFASAVAARVAMGLGSDGKLVSFEDTIEGHEHPCPCGRTEDGRMTKTAVVTGAARGIGRALAVGLAEAGYDVAVTDLAAQADGLAETRALIEAAGRRAFVETVDVSDRAAVVAAMARIEDAAGGIDVLVNNAGILKPARLEDLSEADWDAHMDVNVKGVLSCCQAVLPGMRARKAGRIVNIASIAGRQGVPTQGHYAATKAAVITLTRVLAQEAGMDGITVNAICPGIIPDRDGQEQPRLGRGHPPLGRGGRAEASRRARRYRGAGPVLRGRAVGLRHRAGAERLRRDLLPLDRRAVPPSSAAHLRRGPQPSLLRRGTTRCPR